MDDEIVLENPSTVVKLDQDEEALLNEIEITPPKPKPKPFKRKPAPPPPVIEEEFAQEEPDLDVFANPNKQNAPRKPPPVEYDYGEEEFDENEMDYEQEAPRMSGEEPSQGYSSIDEEKADLLNKLTRLEKKGFKINKKLNAYSAIEDLRTEVKRITYSIEIDQSIKFSRRMLVACVTGLEFLNKRYDPLNLQLDGWSESVMENLDDYDGVFEDLHNKYKTKIQVAPEVKLIMMLAGSGMMFHLTNSMFKAAIPNMNDVLKQNPTLVNDMVNAVKNTVPKNQQPQQSSDGRPEMQGPGLDISSLMGNIMMPPPPPMNTTLPVVQEKEEDDISDIVSVSGESTGGETREIKVSGGKKRGKGKKANEVTLD